MAERGEKGASRARSFPKADAWERRLHPPPEVTVLGCSPPSLSTASPLSKALNGHCAPAMSITLVSNSYLDENSAKIRAKPVPWEVLQAYSHTHSAAVAHRM